MKGITLMVRGFALVAALALVLPTQALSQDATKAGVVTTLQGTASVARATAKEPMPLKFRDDVFVQDRITTGDDSIVRILLGGKAVVTVRERSVLTISETPTTATIEVGSGKIAVAVAKERMRAGDSVEVKTPNAVAGIRGTILIAEVSHESESRANTQFTLLTGIVDVSGLDAATGRAAGPRVTMQPLQTLGMAGFARPSAPRNISRADAHAVASAYKVTIPTPPIAANAPMVERQVEQGLAAAAALVPDPKVDPKATADGPGQDTAGDAGMGGQSAKDRKAAKPGSGGGNTSPAPTSGPVPSGPAPTAPAPTAPVPTAPAPAPPPVAVTPPPATPPPPVVPPVASIPLPGNDKKGGLLDDLGKKLPKLPKPR